jgi:uncharacterized protein
MRKCLGLVAALWLAASAGWAVDWKSLKPQGYVSDFAGVVDRASKARLEAYAADLQRATGARLALVTIPTLQGEPLDDVAATIAGAWNLTHTDTDKNDGVLLLLSVQDRRVRLEIGRRLAAVLPGGLDGVTLWEMRPALRAQNYGEALMAAAETLGATIAHVKHAKLTATLPRRMRPTVANSILWPVVFCAILELAVLAFLLTWAFRRSAGGTRAFRPLKSFERNPPLFLPSGTHSGGGFGAFDSSDSFGGFGGGDRTPSVRGCGGSNDW